MDNTPEQKPEDAWWVFEIPVPDFAPEDFGRLIGRRVLVTITRPGPHGKQLVRSAAGVLAGAQRRNTNESGSMPDAWPTLWFEHQREEFKIPLTYSDGTITVTAL